MNTAMDVASVVLFIILNDSRKYVHLTQEVFTDRDNPRIEIEVNEA